MGISWRVALGGVTKYVQNGCWLILIPGRLGESAGKECPDSSMSQFLFGGGLPLGAGESGKKRIDSGASYEVSGNTCPVHKWSR